MAKFNTNRFEALILESAKLVIKEDKNANYNATDGSAIMTIVNEILKYHPSLPNHLNDVLISRQNFEKKLTKNFKVKYPKTESAMLTADYEVMYSNKKVPQLQKVAAGIFDLIVGRIVPIEFVVV